MPRFPNPRFLLPAIALLAALVLGGLPAGASGRLRSTTTTSFGTAVSDATSTALGTGAAANPVCSPATLQSARQNVTQELSNRSTQLQTLTTRVSNTKDIPSSDASALDTIIANEQIGIVDGGISGLESMVPDATTCLQVIVDARTMVRAFRVYSLVSLQVDLTAVATTESAVVTQALAQEPKVQSVISAAQGRGTDVIGAQQAYSDLQAKLAAAQSSLGAVSISTLLAQVPSDYPGDATALVGYHNDVVAVATDLRAADEDLHRIVTDLTS